MAKTKIIYACQSCGTQHPKWAGQCKDCGEWNTLIEEVFQNLDVQKRGYAAEMKSQVKSLSEIELSEEIRHSTRIKEFDRVLGGGLVMGSVVLAGGDPGVGKSTLLLQTLFQLSQQYSTLYVTGEESLQQVTLRAKRMGMIDTDMQLLAETSVERIIQIALKHKPQVMVIDSIQTMHTEALQSAPGGVGQVRESAARLVQFAKQTDIAIFIIGHVTKDGQLAGPRVLEHMVDTVLYFEGERDSRFRMIRAVKNRFGAINELGIFAMTDQGLKEINNPSAIFLSRYSDAVSGSTVMVTWEGSRPILVEVQALVDTSHLGNPRRVTVGLEQNRLAMLLAVLHRHGGVPTYDQDVFANVVGGVRVSETAADLSLLASIVSSLRNQALPQDLIVFGEVGLSGEIRPVQSGQERLKEASKHGFKRAIVPKGNMPKKKITGLNIVPVTRLDEALSALNEL